MTPISDLDRTLAALDPQVQGNYVFATSDSVPPGLEPFALIREAEGLTMVVEATEAYRLGLGEHSLYSRITPSLSTELQSVGLTATISQTFASRGISCNVIAGFHHDHFFVPAEKSQEALSLLNSLSEQARGWLAD